MCEDVDSWFLVIEVSLSVKQGRLAFDDGTAVAELVLAPEVCEEEEVEDEG